ncbi:VOC family protein [soil metagenome]
MKQTTPPTDDPRGDAAGPLTATALTPYVCPRRCGEAIDWYVEVLDAAEDGQRYVDPDGRIGHAEILIGSARMMLSDEYLDYGVVAPPPGNTTATFALQLDIEDADATVAKAAAAGAVVQRAVDEQLAGYRMGTIMDPFGIRWMISTPVRDVSEEERAAAAREFSESGAPAGPVG